MTQLANTQTKQQPVGNPKSRTIRDLLVRHKDQLMAALPKHVTADRLIRVAMTTINNNYRLLDCSQDSLLKCIVTCAQFGLIPDPVTGEAYLVPFKTKNGTMCQLIIGYKGLVKLARQSGEITAIDVRPVFTKDKFEVKYGLHPNIDHVPYEGADRGELRAVYAVAHFRQQGVIQWDVMWKHEIDDIRARSRAANDGPWVTDYVAMAEKTMVRHLMKMLPQSPEVVRAIDVNDRFETGEVQFDDAIDVRVAEEEPAPKTKAIDRIKKRLTDDKKVRTPEPETEESVDQDPDDIPFTPDEEEDPANDIEAAFEAQGLEDDDPPPPKKQLRSASKPSAAESKARSTVRDEVKKDLDKAAKASAKAAPAEIVEEESDADEGGAESEAPEDYEETEVISQEQIDQVGELWEELGYGDKQIKSQINHFHAERLDQMSAANAKQYLDYLQKAKEKRSAGKF